MRSTGTKGRGTTLLALCLLLKSSQQVQQGQASSLLARQGAQASSHMLSQQTVGAVKGLNDDRAHADADVAAYAQAVASGAKFVEKDSHKKRQVEDAEAQLDSPLAMALDAKDLKNLKKLSQESKTKTIVKDEEQIAAEVGDEGLDITDMVQLQQSINSDASSNSISSAKSVQQVNQKANTKVKSKTKLHDNPWDTMIQMNSMTTSVIDKATPKAPKRDDSGRRLEAQKAAEEEKAAITDARNELLKPEPMDKTALQTGSMTKNGLKFIEETSEREGDKLGEIIRENAEAAAVGSLDAAHQPEKTEEESRASLSQVLKSEQQNKDEVDEIINTRVVNLEDLAGKSDTEMRRELDKMKTGEKASAADKQKELNRKTLESLAESSSTVDEDRDSQKLATLQKEISTEEQEQDQTEKTKPEKPVAAPAKKAAPKPVPAPTPQPKKEQPTAQQAQEKLSLTSGADSVIDQVVENQYGPPQNEDKKEQAAQSLAATEEPTPAAPAPTQSNAQEMPSQGDIAAVLEKVMEQQAASGQKVDVSDINPEMIAQMMAQSEQAAGGSQAPAAEQEQAAPAQSLAEAQPEPAPRAEPTKKPTPAPKPASKTAPSDAKSKVDAVVKAALKRQAAAQPAPQAPAEPAAQADPADQFEKETEQLTKDSDASLLPPKVASAPVLAPQPAKTAVKAAPKAPSASMAKKAALVGKPPAKAATKPTPAKPKAPQQAKSAAPATSAAAPSVAELTKKAVANALKAAKDQGASPQPAPQPLAAALATPVVVPPAPEAPPAPDAEQQETITSNIAAFRKTTEPQPATQMNQISLATLQAPSGPSLGPVAASSVATDANGNIVVDAAPLPAAPAEPTIAAQAEVPLQTQPQELMAQQTMTIPAGASIPVGYEVVGADTQAQAAATIPQQLAPEQQVPILQANAPVVQQQPAQALQQTTSQQTQVDALVNDAAQAIGVQDQPADTQAQVIPTTTQAVDASTIQSLQQAQIMQAQATLQGQTIVDASAQAVPQVVVQEQAPQQLAAAEVLTTQPITLDANTAQPIQSMAVVEQPAQMMAQQETAAVQGSQEQSQGNAVDFLEQQLSKPAGSFIQDQAPLQTSAAPKTTLPLSSPKSAAQSLIKASNPGALDVLGDLVESTSATPMDNGLLATKGALKANAHATRSGQIMLSVAPNVPLQKQATPLAKPVNQVAAAPQAVVSNPKMIQQAPLIQPKSAKIAAPAKPVVSVQRPLQGKAIQPQAQVAPKVAALTKIPTSRNIVPTAQKLMVVKK